MLIPGINGIVSVVIVCKWVTLNILILHTQTHKIIVAILALAKSHLSTWKEVTH